MNITTIGSSPYLLLRNSRINADILRHFASLGHSVASLAWAHDEGYFMPDKEGLSGYEHDGRHVCPLYPFRPAADQIVFVYEMMKKLQPKMVVTVGDCHEVSFLHAVKAMYPSFFKWVAVFTVESEVVNEKLRDSLQYVDEAVVLTEFAERAVRAVYSGPVVRLRYGPSKAFRRLEGVRASHDFRALATARNFQTSNIPAFLKAVGRLGGRVKGHLHSNFYDVGESDLNLLMERYGASPHVSVTEDFCSIREGIADESLNDLYNRTHVVTDTSTSSAAALSLLEAMGTGMVPVGTDYGAVGEVIRAMPEEFRFQLPHELLVGGGETEFAVVSSTMLEDRLLRLQNMYVNEPHSYLAASEAAQVVSGNFLKEEFLAGLQKEMESVARRGDTVLLSQHT